MDFHVLVTSTVGFIKSVTALRTKIAFDVDPVQFFDFEADAESDAAALRASGSL